MRAALAIIAALSTMTVLASCGASVHQPSVTATPSANPSVVDGITVPPVYVTPADTVVPGPMTCPVDFAATLASANAGATFTLTSALTAHLLTCGYQAATAPAGDCTAANILVNTEPQAYKAFDRWNVETGQNSMWTGDPALRPTPVYGIGIEAEWVPALLELGTGNDTTWVSVTLTCPPGRPSVQQLAEQLAVEGLASSA